MAVLSTLDMQETIEGKFTYLVFQAKDSDFRVISIKTNCGYRTLKGNNLPTNKNATYRFHGKSIVSNNKPCFKVDTFENVTLDKLEEATKNGAEDISDKMVDYISSGIFPGIGKQTAKLIVEKFGDDALRIIKEDTMKLVDIKGISEKKACKIQAYLKENAFVTEIKDVLMGYGISDESCRKLIKLYGKDTLNMIKEDPYTLIHDIHLPFLEADKIILQMGMNPSDYTRIQAAFKHIMSKTITNGHTGIEYFACKSAIMKLLETNHAVTNDHMLEFFRRAQGDSLFKVAQIPDFDGKEKIFLFSMSYYKAEEQIARDIFRIKRSYIKIIETVEKDIKELEKEKGITLDKTQKEAIEKCLSTPFSVLTGGPGTGKTTIMDFIVSIYEKNVNSNIILLAPSGKAARRLAESTGRETKTIHSQLGIYDIECDNENAEHIKNSLVIVDEFSMVDVKICNKLFSYIDNGCIVICVGDTNQLPSVGAGAVLRDMLEEQFISHVELTRIFRQAEHSNILQNTLKVNEGNTNLTVGSDFHIYYEWDLEKCKRILTNIYLKRIKEYGIENVMMLLPYRKKVTAGVDDMNKHLQSVVNPPSEEKEEGSAYGKIYRIGDPVMHVNNNNEQVSNGDTGVITSVRYVDDMINVHVNINGKTIIYDKEMLEHLDLAYATTIHKSQGSEYKSVITCLTYNHNVMLYRNIPYVAFSRGKQVVDFVGDKGLDYAIRTTKSNQRITLLKYMLESSSGRMHNDIFRIR